MIYKFLNRKPRYGYNVFIAPSADVIGDIELGEESSIWFNATVRGDVNYIRIGRRSNIQDNACVHVTNRTAPTHIGNLVTVGHGAVVHGCTLHDRVLVGINSTILDKAIVESDVIVAAGTLVPPGKRLESGYLYMGSPARQVRELTDEDRQMIVENAENYVTYSRAHMQLDSYDHNPFYDDPEERDTGKREEDDASEEVS